MRKTGTRRRRDSPPYPENMRKNELYAVLERFQKQCGRRPLCRHLFLRGRAEARPSLWRAHGRASSRPRERGVSGMFLERPLATVRTEPGPPMDTAALFIVCPGSVQGPAPSFAMTGSGGPGRPASPIPSVARHLFANAMRRMTTSRSPAPSAAAAIQKHVFAGPSADLAPSTS